MIHSPNTTELDNATVYIYQKSFFVLMISRNWLTQPATPKLSTETTTKKRNEFLKTDFEQYTFLAVDGDSDLLYKRTYSEIECDLLSKTQIGNL